MAKLSIKDRLKSKIQEITASGLKIAEGREEGDLSEILGDEVVVKNWEFGQAEFGDYVAFTIEGNDEEFYFGGSVVTENFLELNAMLSDEEVEELKEEGLPMLLTEKKSKNKRKYINNTFYPNEQ